MKLTTKEKAQVLAVFLITPFAAGAAYEFLPPWVGLPVVLLSTIFWLGSIAAIVNDVD